MKKCSSFLVALFVLLSTLVPASMPVIAASGPSLRTTLTDHAVQKGSKKTFDVWARNSAGKKIKASVTFNGEKLSPTWDDTEKASYTLHFTNEGENVVVVSASSDGGVKKTLTYRIIYQKAQPGEAIGTAVWSIEAFTLGCGYLIEPVKQEIYEGESAAQQLLRLLHANGYVGYYGGSPESAFYLAYIAGGTSSREKFNNYQKSGSPDSPRELNLSPRLPSLLVPHLQQTMTFFDPDDYAKNWSGYLGEFVITNGSGWMYSVNNIFPNVGFSDSYPSDGDVIRVQFTLGYGADIGGFGAMGTEIPDVDTQPVSGYYPVADKDALTVLLAQAKTSGLLTKANMKTAYSAAMSAAMTLDLTQSEVDRAVAALSAAFSDPGGETDTPPSSVVLPQESSSSSGAQTTSRTPGHTTVSSGSDHAEGSASGTMTTTSRPAGPLTAGSYPTESHAVKITDDGAVVDVQGNILGTIVDGDVVDEEGHVVGYVEDGVIVDNYGDVLGDIVDEFPDSSVEVAGESAGAEGGVSGAVLDAMSKNAEKSAAPIWAVILPVVGVVLLAGGAVGVFLYQRKQKEEQ